jgi:glycosyltransferase involved in cell wall biosynthesis
MTPNNIARSIANLASPEWRLVDKLRQAPHEKRNALLPRELRTSDQWQSWDPAPFSHPWLNVKNLTEVRHFNDRILARIVGQYGGSDSKKRSYGFVGNLANNMTMRALPLRKAGYKISIFLHPQDHMVMSQPGWEFFDQELSSSETNTERLAADGVTLPDVPETYKIAETPQQGVGELVALAVATAAFEWRRVGVPRFVRQRDLLLWPGYFSFLDVLKSLQHYDCLLAAQAPYLAYLSGRPYLTSQTGGDLWLESARHDAFGNLQRLAYRSSSAILATNPWAYSNARRYGFKHVLYVPLLVDMDRYAPGAPTQRESWKAQVGGDFFALMTSRIDRTWKGSHIGLEGFRRFAERHPGARLVVVGWGAAADDIEMFKAAGIEGKVITLPIIGKPKLIECLRSADCLIDQFMIGYYGATALEAMSTGLPVTMHLRRDQYDALCPTGAPPTLDAQTEDEVAHALQKLYQSPDERRTIADASRQWIARNHSVEVWGIVYGALLNAVASGAKLNFRRSPLARPLTRMERDYHADCLSKAPAFPNYII